MKNRTMLKALQLSTLLILASCSVDARLNNPPTTSGGTTNVIKVLDVTNYGVVGDDATNNATPLQTLIDANPNATIYFPYATYRFGSQIILTNSSGKAFAGNIKCDQAILKFTNAGNTTDTDAVMQNGIVAYPKTNGAGGDTSGWTGKIEGCIIDGPANGASIHLANGIGQTLERVKTQNNRYGKVFESSINVHIIDSKGFNWKNASLGFLYSANSNVYYGATPTTSFWNDSYRIDGYEMADGATNGTFACILDHGSNAERIRWLNGVSCQGKTGKTGVQYGYVGRLVFPIFGGTNWFESINYGLRIFSSNSAEGGSGTAITGVTAAQPNGTMTVGAMPDGYCTGGVFNGLYDSGALIAWQPDCNGNVNWGGSFTNGATTDLKLTQGGKRFNYNACDTRGDGGVPVIINSFGGFIDNCGASPSIQSGGGTSPPAIAAGSNSKSFRFQIGTGGVASAITILMDRTAPNGWNCNCQDLTTQSATVFACKQSSSTTTTVTFTNYNTSGAAAAWVAGDTVKAECEMLY